MDIKYNELNKYLTNNNCFGTVASIRKKTIIYTFVRFFVAIGLELKVKVDKETKNVISILHKGKEYTDLEEIKKLVESVWTKPKLKNSPGS